MGNRYVYEIFILLASTLFYMNNKKPKFSGTQVVDNHIVIDQNRQK